MSRNRQKPGDWNVITDCCGRTMKFSQVLRQWDGMIVCPDHYDPRHPLDFVKSTHDDQRVPISRSPPVTDSFIIDTDGTVSSTNVITNGTFAADTDWTKQTGWTIAGGKADCDGSQSDTTLLFQDASLLPSCVYSVTFTISSYSAGSLYAKCGADGYGTKREADGTYIERIPGIGPPYPRIYFEASSDFIGKIDTVTAYLVTY